MKFLNKLFIAFAVIMSPLLSINSFAQEESASNRLSIEEIIVTGTEVPSS